VYALVELAADGEDFPIDYNKSAFSVICDVLAKHPAEEKLRNLLDVMFRGLQSAYPEQRTELGIESLEFHVDSPQIGIWGTIRRTSHWALTHIKNLGNVSRDWRIKHLSGEHCSKRWVQLFSRLARTTGP
jgi:hypothetical protein